MTTIDKRLFLQKHAIIFPEDILRVKADSLSYGMSSDNLIPKLVFYIDSTECTSCVVTNLGYFNQLDSLLENETIFETVVILSPPSGARKSLIDDLKVFPPKRTVYIDQSGSFAHNNPFIPDDPIYHAFLLDLDNHPIFIGNPISGTQIKSAFIEVLKSINKNN